LRKELDQALEKLEGKDAIIEEMRSEILTLKNAYDNCF
jgi:hypothetical protein